MFANFGIVNETTTSINKRMLKINQTKTFMVKKLTSTENQ